jgi:hypothetical protein
MTTLALADAAPAQFQVNRRMGLLVLAPTLAVLAS